MSMSVIDVQPEDIHITFKISLKSAEALLKAIDMSKVDFNGEDTDETVAVNTLKKFFDMVNGVVEDIKHGS